MASRIGTPVSVFVLALASLPVQTVARAEPADAKDEARQHFEAGRALVANEDYAAAAAEFELSVRIYPTKSGLFNLANCYKALNRYGDSLDTLLRLEREFAGNLDYLEAEVATMKSTIEGMVGRLEVRVDRDGAVIRVDGREVGVSPLDRPLVLAPGDRVVEARYPGCVDASRTVRIVARELQEVALVLEERRESGPEPALAATEGPEPEALASVEEPATVPAVPVAMPNRGLRAGAWTCFIVGAGAGLASLATFGFASIKADEFAQARGDYEAFTEDFEEGGPSSRAAVDGPRLWDEMQSAREGAEAAGRIGLGLGIGAGVLVAASVAMFVASRPRAERAEETVSVVPAPGGLAVEF
jgi:tetratricopeptide (TPR) repeat protein